MVETTKEKIKNCWIKRAEHEGDIFNKFISYWIAFNCWYSSRYKIKLEFGEELRNNLHNLNLGNDSRNDRDKNVTIEVNSNSDVIEWVYIV